MLCFKDTYEKNDNILLLDESLITATLTILTHMMTEETESTNNKPYV